MFERERNLYAVVLDFAKKAMADVDESTVHHQPHPGMNTPAWVIGHLCVVADSAAKMLGLPRTCPKEWHQSFGIKSDPAKPTVRPTKAELLACLEAQHARVSEAASRVTEEQLAAPHPYEIVKAMFPTVGELLLHMMTTHPMLHLGQLSAWRRIMGLGSVLGL
jgi:hypothetical protein